jgi:TrmH family RNA methyltransferase
LKHVTSRDNALFKQLKALTGSTHQRRKAGRPCSMASISRRPMWLLGQPASCVVSERHYDHAEVRALLEKIDSDKLVVLADELFAQISSVVNGVDLMLVIETPAGHLPATSIPIASFWMVCRMRAT